MVIGMKINVPAVCFGLKWAQQEHGKNYEKINYIGTILKDICCFVPPFNPAAEKA